MVSDLHSIIRVALGRQDQPGAVVPDGRTLQCAGAVAGGACNARQRARARLGANAVRGAATGSNKKDWSFQFRLPIDQPIAQRPSRASRCPGGNPSMVATRGVHTVAQRKTHSTHGVESSDFRGVATTPKI